VTDQVENSTQDTQEEDVGYYKSKIEYLEKQLNSVTSKHAEFLGEVKRAKEEKNKLKELAQKSGDWEEAYKQKEQELQEISKALQQKQQSYKEEKISTSAMKIAMELADGDAARAKLLAIHVKQKLSSLSDEDGNVDDSVYKTVTKEFAKSPDYAPLIGGTKATGGSAAGNTKGSAQDGKPQVSRSEFESMTPSQQHHFLITRRGVVIE
jgi:DNA repair exonuclease SbcCD ATPase subunit